MALANAACLMAGGDEKRKVLMVDWDLEAPGLHRYFSTSEIQEQDPELINFLNEMEEKISKIGRIEEDDPEKLNAITEKLFTKVDPANFINKSGIPSLDFMKSGSFDGQHSNRVNEFQWDLFFEKAPWFFLKFGDWLAERYDYVLIDSRTGMSDVSQICTTLMPEVLVMVFTPNQQSLTGVEELVQQATKYRRESEDERPLSYFHYLPGLNIQNLNFIKNGV